MSYEAPIQMQTGEIIRRVREEQDKKIYEAVLECEINVSKEELVKALKYDRDQYVKGYADAEIQLLELENMDKVVRKLNVLLLKNKLTIKGMAGEKLIIIDQTTGEEYIVEDLGYPF